VKALLIGAVAWCAWLAVDSLAQDAPHGPSPIAYSLSPQSRLDVVTRKAGVLGGFGHDHRIRARSFSGTIVYDAAHVAASKVEITVQTRNLDVLPIGADRRDGPRVEKAMRDHVLHPDRFPTITFRSRSVTPIEDRLRVTGDLTLAGQTHPVTVDMKVQAGERQLIATGAFSIDQTDWGIEPYSAALGTIKVADEVTFELRVVGVPVGR
jgi:polyisoprenoid-binding protein YceI